MQRVPPFRTEGVVQFGQLLKSDLSEPGRPQDKGSSCGFAIGGRGRLEQEVIMFGFEQAMAEGAAIEILRAVLLVAFT